ncbi:hypothetical protein N7488_008673 [Penicillium malachiteum]|nr:hypothetical protein N7488_008673 [Penicillium malachiteum]
MFDKASHIPPPPNQTKANPVTVIKPLTTSDYPLSGIFLSHLAPPRDRNSAELCSRRSRQKFSHAQFIQARPALLDEHPVQYYPYDAENLGYTLHAHCWVILGHLLGKEQFGAIEKLPGEAFRAAKQYWLQSLSDPKEPCAQKWNLDTSQVDHYRYHGYNSPYDPPYKHGCAIYRKPWVVPEVQTAIELAQDRGNIKRTCSVSGLPLDIWLLVVEDICPVKYTRLEVTNLRNMYSVFSFNLPEFFWGRRSQRELSFFFELDLLTKDECDSLDWQFLFLCLVELLSDEKWFPSGGLANRDRVLKPIKGIIANLELDGCT